MDRTKSFNAYPIFEGKSSIHGNKSISTVIFKTFADLHRNAANETNRYNRKEIYMRKRLGGRGSGKGGARVCFGGSGSDSRQHGSVMAGYWIRLQPELPQYVQYNVLLCSPLPAQLTSAAGALPAWRTTITTKTHPQKITHSDAEVHTAQARKTAPIHLTGRGVAHMKLDKVGKQTAEGHKLSFFAFFFLPLPAPSASLTISAHRWLQTFDVSVGQLHCCH